jgi:hypothetical protein
MSVCLNWPLLACVLVVAGCGGANAKPHVPRGRSFASQPAHSSQAPAPTGDPPAEGGGTVSRTHAAVENGPRGATVARSPEAALRHYALLYTNWRARALLAREHELASLAAGPARLAIEQAIASQSGAVSLAVHHVENRGVVLSIAPGEGRARARWVVVTEELTTGTGPYAGLPRTLQVTLARVVWLGPGWVVCEWAPGR